MPKSTVVEMVGTILFGGHFEDCNRIFWANVHTVTLLGGSQAISGLYKPNARFNESNIIKWKDIPQYNIDWWTCTGLLCTFISIEPEARGKIWFVCIKVVQ